MEDWKEKMRARGEEVRGLMAQRLSHQESLTLSPRQLGDIVDYIQMLKEELLK